MVQYVRSNFYAGEQFRDLGDCRQRAEQWCAVTAGLRIHGTTRLRPAEVFSAEELPVLGPVPQEVFDIPVWTQPKVAPDRHVQIARALHSVPGELIGKRIEARADGHAVKLYWRGELIKVHPVMAPGRRHTDPADLPTEVSIYAMRDLNALQRKAAAHGTHVGTYATAVQDACRRALDAEVIDVGLIERILTRGGGEQLPLMPKPCAHASRFVRESSEFSVRRPW